MTFSHDRMVNAPVQPVADTTMALLDRLQGQPPETQALSLAALFILVTERFQVNGRGALQAAANILVNREGQRQPAFEAARMYLRNELT